MWEGSEVEGFKFEDFDANDSSDVGSIMSYDFNKKKEENINNFEILPEYYYCAMCNKSLLSNVIFDGDMSFCSEQCWRSLIYITVRDLSLGGIATWPIDSFTSYKSKLYIIYLASRIGNADFLLELIINFRGSLEKEVLSSLLYDNKFAFDNYLDFLRKTNQNELATELLVSHGFMEEAKLSKYISLYHKLFSESLSNAEKNSQSCRVFAMAELSNETILQPLYMYTLQMADLLSYQAKKDSEWKQFSKILDSTYKTSYTNPSSLFGETLADTIRCSILMNGGFSLGGDADTLKTNYKMSDSQLRWVSIEPLISISNQADLERIVMEKKRLSRKQVLTLPGNRFLRHLRTVQASNEVIASFLPLISDTESPLELACQLNLYSAALQYCVQKRDVRSLHRLLQFVPKDRPEYKQAITLLSVPTESWTS